MIRTLEIQALTFPLVSESFLWTHLGDGELTRIHTYNHHTGWVGTDAGSFLITPQETVYRFDTVEEKELTLRLFQERLRVSRKSHFEKSEVL